MDKFITIQGQRIEVTDDVYAAYYKDNRREKYRDIDVKKGRFVVDAEAESVRYVESKEDSFGRSIRGRSTPAAGADGPTERRAVHTHGRRTSSD